MDTPVVTNYITCDAPIDSPIPTIDMLVERLGQLCDGSKPVTAKALDSSFVSERLRARSTRPRPNTLDAKSGCDGTIA